MNALFQKLLRRTEAAWRNAPRPWNDEESWRTRRNNVDAIRAILALLVIWFHGPILLGVDSDSPIAPAFAQEPLEQIHFVGFRVLCFFWLSGFLLARSWDRAPRVVPFVGRRIARLYPAFLVCAGLCLLVLFAVTPNATLPGWRTVWRYLITLRLPEAIGVFPHNDIAHTLNGSLWTLLYEAWCCVALVILGTFGVLRRGKPLVVLLCGVWLLYVFQWFGVTPFPLPGESFQTWILFGAADAYPPLLTCFLSGVAFHRYRDRIPWHPALFATSLGGLFLAISVGVTGPAIPVFGVYCLAYLAFHPRRLFPNWLSGWGSLSYGIFLYSYPIQQLWIHYTGDNLTADSLFLVTIPPVLLLAYLSYRWIENPIDRWQKQQNRKRTGGAASAQRAALPPQLQVGVRQGP
ncbi:MAG: acyltransferase [Fibrella sp.]|nr:acyltransferase [Armatimonadota bacterium]